MRDLPDRFWFKTESGTWASRDWLPAEKFAYRRDVLHWSKEMLSDPTDKEVIQASAEIAQRREATFPA